MGGTLLLGGTVLSTAASLLNSDSREKDYYKSLATSADKQAAVTQETARRNASYIFEDAAYENTQLSRQYSALLGKQKTALAASGLGSGSATAQMILKNSRLNALLDQEMLSANMNRSIYETNTQAALQAQQYHSQAQQYREANRRRGSMLNRVGWAFNQVFPAVKEVFSK